MTERKPPDNVERGRLAEKIRARMTPQKITDPEEQKRVLDRFALSLGPGANTVKRRGRY